MSTPRPESEDNTAGLSLREVLRASLGAGLLVIPAGKKPPVISPRAAIMLGLDSGSNSTLANLPPRLQRMIQTTFKSRRPISNRHLVIRKTSREPACLLVNTLVSRATGRKASEVVVVLNNISPVYDLERHAQRLDRLASIGIFAASMTHEIRNALVAVKTFVDLLLKENRDADLAEIVKREISRIDSMVSQVLKFAGPGKPGFREIPLHQTLDHALRLIQHQLDRKNISLNRSFGASTDVVKGDDYQLEQAFFNLLFNAVEATSPNGRLSVATDLMPVRAGAALSSRSSAQVRVTISDTGFGIHPEHIDRIFEPFFTTKPNGTGLGLPIARRIVQEHQGTIQVESQVNRGTTFSITLPAAKGL